MPTMRRATPHVATIELGEDADGTKQTETVNFYPVSLAKLLTLRTFSQSLGTAVVEIISVDPNHVAGQSQDVKRDTDGNILETHTQVERADPTIIHNAQVSRKSGIDRLIKVLTEPANVDVLCGLLKDSMRDEEEMTVEELKAADASIISQYALGWVTANRKVVDPLLDGVRDMVEDARKRIDAKGPRPIED